MLARAVVGLLYSYAMCHSALDELTRHDLEYEGLGEGVTVSEFCSTYFPGVPTDCTSYEVKNELVVCLCVCV